MKRGVVVVAFALAALVRADEVAVPVAKEPQQVTPAPKRIPQRMLVPEARILFDALRAQTAASFTPEAEEVAPTPDPGMRTFEIDAPAPATTAAQFTFEDVTDRTVAPAAGIPAPVLTIDQRKAAVEAFRRAVARRRAAE